jgi:hypothetical protein
MHLKGAKGVCYEYQECPLVLVTLVWQGEKMGAKGRPGKLNCSSTLVLTALTTMEKFNAKEEGLVFGLRVQIWFCCQLGNFVFINILHNIWKEPNTFTPQNPGPGWEVWKPEGWWNVLPGEGTHTRLAMAKSHVGLRWVGGHWVGWVGSMCYCFACRKHG